MLQDPPSLVLREEGGCGANTSDNCMAGQCYQPSSFLCRGRGGGGAGLVIASRWREAVKSPGDPKSEAYSCISTLWLAWHPWAAPYLEVVSPQINTGC